MRATRDRRRVRSPCVSRPLIPHLGEVPLDRFLAEIGLFERVQDGVYARRWEFGKRHRSRKAVEECTQRARKFSLLDGRCRGRLGCPLWSSRRRGGRWNGGERGLARQTLVTKRGERHARRLGATEWNLGADGAEIVAIFLTRRSKIDGGVTASRALSTLVATAVDPHAALRLVSASMMVSIVP